MAINWSNLGEKIPGIATAVEEGLLRQQELGGVAYTAAAQKESARISGEAEDGRKSPGVGPRDKHIFGGGRTF